MEHDELVAVVKNIDLRVGRIEQFLPSVATKEDLKAFATKEDLEAYPTRDELRAEIATLATKDELREESERTRNFSRVLYESLHDDVRILAEAVAANTQELKYWSGRFFGQIENHETRLLRLESVSHPRD